MARGLFMLLTHVEAGAASLAMRVVGRFVEVIVARVISTHVTWEVTVARSMDGTRNHTGVTVVVTVVVTTRV